MYPCVDVHCIVFLCAFVYWRVYVMNAVMYFDHLFDDASDVRFLWKQLYEKPDVVLERRLQTDPA